MHSPTMVSSAALFNINITLSTIIKMSSVFLLPRALSVSEPRCPIEAIYSSEIQSPIPVTKFATILFYIMLPVFPTVKLTSTTSQPVAGPMAFL